MGEKRPVLTFLLLAFAISWGIFGFGYASGLFKRPQGFGLVAFAFMFGPALSALICGRIWHRGEMVRVLGLGPKFNRWMLAAWLVPMVLAALSVLFSLMAPGEHLVPLGEAVRTAAAEAGVPIKKAIPYLGVIVLVSALFIGAAINGVLLITEELGWRGFLWHHLEPYGFWRACLITGVVWGLWHAPLIVMGLNYPGMPVVGIALMVVFTTLITPIISYIRMKNGSVWAASLFHGTINALGGLTVLVLSPHNFPWNGIVGAGGFAALALGVAGVYWALRRDRAVQA